MSDEQRELLRCLPLTQQIQMLSLPAGDLAAFTSLPTTAQVRYAAVMHHYLQLNAHRRTRRYIP